MPSKSKAKGTRFETDVVNYLRARGFTAQRLPPAGNQDMGDIVFLDGPCHVVVEAKAERRIDLPRYLRQAEAEAQRYLLALQLPEEQVRSLVIVKRRMASIGQSYCVTTLDAYVGDGLDAVRS